MILTYPSSTGSVLANGSFESGLTPWWAGPTSVIVNDNAQSGTFAGRMSTISDGFKQGISRLTAGATYQLSGFLKVTNAAEEVRIGVKDYGGAELSNPVNSTSYKQAVINFTPTGSTATVYCWKWTGTSFAYCDNLQVSKL
jgi:carbohydrate binding protein with CBM4/9 domain